MKNMKIKRLFIPSQNKGNANIIARQPIDSAAWLWHPEVKIEENAFLVFRKDFEADGSPLRIHVSADARYELQLDGALISRGPHRGDLRHWPYSSYEIELPKGSHEFKALVWRLDEMAMPIAQLSFRGGFVFKAEGAYDNLLTTGVAPWLVARAGGWKHFEGKGPGVFGTGTCFEWNDGLKLVESEREASVVRPPLRVENPYGETASGWFLEPSPLPDMMSVDRRIGKVVSCGASTPDDTFRFHAGGDSAPWTALLLKGKPLTIQANAEAYALIDLETYITGFPKLEVSGGKDSALTWAWAETLVETPSKKGCRDDIENKLFLGTKDLFHGDGSAKLKMSIPWWRSGRYCLLSVKTGKEPLTINGVSIEETGYPFERESAFTSDLKDVSGIIAICDRVMHACAHETFMDCPYYEQLMYVGDTRLEMLTMTAMTHDERLIKRCIDLFDHSRVNFGFVNERYPASRPQHSPTFSLIWTLILHDFVHWHSYDNQWFEERMVCLRSMLEQFMPYVNSDGLLERLPGWPFMDWAPEWKIGTPPGGYDSISCPVNLLYVYVLQKAAELEELAGEKALAERNRGKARKAAQGIERRFWCEKRGMFADDLGKTLFSEHSQALAILAELAKGAEAEGLLRHLLEEKGLVKASSYFVFYVFEAFRKLGRAELILPRVEMWREMLRMGFKTAPEEPRDGTRSDCHAWSAQILFHLHASVAGIRPSSEGFKTVRIEPKTGDLKELHCTVPHPTGGFIEFSLKEEKLAVTLPEGLSGELCWKGQVSALKPGRQSFS